MSRNGNNSPSMDLNELLRKHDEYKQRQRRTTAPAPQPAVQRTEIKPHPAETKSVIEEPVRTPPAEEPPVQTNVEPTAPQEPEEIQPAAPVEDVSIEDVIASGPVSVPQENEQPDIDGDGEAFDDEDDGSEPNPFNSMVSIFRTAFGKLRRKPKADEDDGVDDDPVSDEAYEAPAESDEPDMDDLILDEDADEPQRKRRKLFGWRKKKEESSDFAYDDSDFAAEDYVAEEFPKIEPDDEIVDSAEEPIDEPEEAPEEPAIIAENVPEDISVPVEDINIIEDIGVIEDVPAADAEPLFSIEDPADDVISDDDFDEPSDMSDESFDDDEGPDEDDEEDEDEDEDGTPKKSIFKRFINLFVVREDDEESPDDNDEDDEDDWNDDGWLDHASSDNSVFDLTTEYKPMAAAFSRNAASAEHKGGTDMDEKNRVNTDMTELLASGLETQGMSRRQRRELAEKQAAEAAAKLAAEEAAKIAAQAAAPTFEPIAAEEPVEEASSEEPVVSELVAPDEPTRIFRPLTSIPSVSADPEPAASIPGFDDEDEEEDEEEAPVQKRRGFSFFHKKHVEEEDEEEDEDEEEEDFDEDEEEEEAPRKSRGLFGKKSRPVKYEEDEDEEDDFDEDEDEEEDYDEEDDYDAYDDFDDEDDEDDYDDEDDDDDRPLGLRIIGFFKGLFAFILCVLIVVCALNVLDYFNVMPLDSVFEHHYNKAPAVFDTLFPSHNLKQLAEPEEGIISNNPINVEATQVPEATDAPVVTMEPVATEVPAVG